MRRHILSIIAFPLALSLSLSAWGQAVSPSEAATVRTPGTPGASDTPGTLLNRPNDKAPAVNSAPAAKDADSKGSHPIPKSKKGSSPP